MATAVIDVQERTHRNVDKIQRYKWDVKDSPGEFRRIDKKHIRVDAMYQRDANGAKVLELRRNWSWVACGTISVAQRDGFYWAMDGQHRVLAAQGRSDIRTMPCMVFDINEVAEEAQGFLNANGNRKPVGAIDKHRARIIAGDPLALKIQETLDSLGLNLSKSARSVGDFGAISLAYRQADDFESFRKVLALAAEICREGEVPVAEKLVDGLLYIDRNTEEGVTERKLQTRIRHVGAERLLEGALRAAAYFARGGARVFAQGMMDVLNKGIHNKFDLIAR